MNEIMTILKQVGIFMVCAQTVVHFKPQQKYDKYLKLLIGIMIMVQLISPIFDFLGKEGDFNAKTSLPKTWQNTSFDINGMLYTAEEIVGRYTENEVKSRLYYIGKADAEGQGIRGESNGIEDAGKENAEEENSKEGSKEGSSNIKVEDIKIDDIRLKDSDEDAAGRTVE